MKKMKNMMMKIKMTLTKKMQTRIVNRKKNKLPKLKNQQGLIINLDLKDLKARRRKALQ